MSKEKTVKFTTYGPNRGLSLNIGNYTFTDGVCEVPESHVSAASNILCRYHDVCYEHELAEKAKAYDAEYADKGPKEAEKPETANATTDSGSRTNVGDDPLINEANAETAKALGKAEGDVDNKEPEAEGEKANDNKGSDSEGNEGSDVKSNNKKKGK